MKYQETPQQDFEKDFYNFIQSSVQTIKAADAVSVFARQKLGEMGNKLTKEEVEQAKSVNKDSEALSNKFASAVNAEKKALQNLIKTYGKTKVHEELQKLNKDLQNSINQFSVDKQPKGERESTLNSMRALKTKTEKHIQETEPFSLNKFIKGLVNAVVKIISNYHTMSSKNMLRKSTNVQRKSQLLPTM